MLKPRLRNFLIVGVRTLELECRLDPITISAESNAAKNALRSCGQTSMSLSTMKAISPVA